MKKKVFVATLAITGLISMSIGAYGATKLQEIKAYLNPSIAMKVNGVPVQLKDSSGLNIVPISYNNTTYLPVRAVSDALQYAVNFEQATNTIHIGERVEGTAISKNFSDMYHTKDPQYTTYANKNYSEVYYNNGTSNREASFMLYPKKQYQKLYLQIAAIDKPIKSLTIKDSGNNIILKTVDIINPEDGLVTVEADIGGVTELYIYASAEKDGFVFVPLTTSYFK